jgi:uncharacterized protein YdiU (UPF0061 family)
MSASYIPDPLYTSLGPGFADEVMPARFPRHALRFRNQRWAEAVGLGDLDDEGWERAFGRFQPLDGNLQKPVATRYHGHQFGSYNPGLGDGRGFLFAQLRGPRGRLLDLGTKGSGTTPYSRGGDGRLTLKGGVREALCTEMLETLGVNTSKTFSLYETGEKLIRHDEPSPTRGAAMVRLSHSHIRFGTFQRHAYHRKVENSQALLTYCTEHLVPVLVRGEGDDLACAFVREVGRRSAETAADVMVAGFVHGVLNTDNMNVTGELFDYGPYRYLPTFDPEFTAAYFDVGGLYAYGKQPDRFLWNVARLAESLVALSEPERLEGALADFDPSFRAGMHKAMCRRLGVTPRGPARDQALVDAVFRFLLSSEMPFDRFFFDHYAGEASRERAMAGSARREYSGEVWAEVEQALDGYAPSHPDRVGDPYFDREEPVSLVYDHIEAIWEPIAEHDDWSGFDTLVQDIRALGRVLAP